MKIPIAEITVDENKVKEVDKETIDKIAASIKQLGQIHPILVQRVNNTYHVVAGLKRLLAHRALGEAAIEVTVANIEMDPDTAEEMSIHENLKRANLEWWQEVKLVEAAHRLYQKRHDKRSDRRRRGRPKDDEADEVWGMRQTAEALGLALGRVSQDIQLANRVELNPALKMVKDKRTAMKLIRKTVQQIEAEEAAGGTDSFAKGGVPRDDLLLGDSMSVLKLIPEMTYDACITDPPWLKFQGRSQLEKDESTDKVFNEVFRVLRFNTFLYAFVGFEDWFYYRDYLPRLGFTVAKTPLIWVKEGAMSPVGVARWEYNRDFELILLAVKGTPALTHSVNQSGVLVHKIVPPRNMIHPHEKPVGLIKKLILDSTYEGSSIIDPFAGSAAVLEAAREMKRSWLGIERDHDSYLNAKKRLGLTEES